MDIIKQIKQIIRELSPNNRAISMPNVYQLVYAELENLMVQTEQYVSLIDVYLDGSSMFAVVGMNGILYKSELSLINGGVQLGELSKVEIDYKPVEQSKSSLRVFRQADGKYRWFAFPAATAVLNRSGELDTRELFTNFVQRIQNGEAPYPYLTIYHLGERLAIGQSDFVEMDGYLYLLSGTFDDTVLANAARDALIRDPEYWGTSIGYYYNSETGREKMELGQGIAIPAYTDGINHEVSMLPEAEAACLFTGLYVSQEGVNRMNAKAKAALKKIAGEDPEAQAVVAELVEKVDGINEEIENKDLVRRDTSTEEQPVTETTTEPAPVEQDKPAEPELPAVPEVEFTDEALDEIASRVAEKMNSALAEQLATIRTEIEQFRTGRDELEKRVAQLEKSDEDKIEQVIEDLPRTTLRVRYRPVQRKNEAEQPTEPESVSLEEIAGDTLAILK